jgi:hypothetical protein
MPSFTAAVTLIAFGWWFRSVQRIKGRRLHYLWRRGEKCAALRHIFYAPEGGSPF